jgi:hypothetical protein
MTSRNDQLTPVQEQTTASDDIIVTNRKATEGDIDAAVHNRSKLINNRDLYPFNRYTGKPLSHLRH